MNKLLKFMTAHGYWFMGLGIVLALSGIFIMMEPRNRHGSMRMAGISIGVAGFVIYFIGRVCVALDRRRPRSDPDD